VVVGRAWTEDAAVRLVDPNVVDACLATEGEAVGRPSLLACIVLPSCRSSPWPRRNSPPTIRRSAKRKNTSAGPATGQVPGR